VLATPVDEDEGRTEEERAQQLAEAEEAEGGEAGTGMSAGLRLGAGAGGRCTHSGMQFAQWHVCTANNGLSCTVDQ